MTGFAPLVADSRDAFLTQTIRSESGVKWEGGFMLKDIDKVPEVSPGDARRSLGYAAKRWHVKGRGQGIIWIHEISKSLPRVVVRSRGGPSRIR